METRRIAIVGSRDYPDLPFVEECVDRAVRLGGKFHFVSGGAPGVDATAEETAKRLKLPRTIFPVDWYDKNGVLDRSAGFQRNQDIVDFASAVPDGLMVCFWDTTSHGTADDIRKWHFKTGRYPRVYAPGRVILSPSAIEEYLAAI